MYALFNAPISSKAMPVECVFERLKRRFRARISKRVRENMAKTIHEECKRLSDADARIAYERAKTWMLRAIARENMWLK